MTLQHGLSLINTNVVHFNDIIYIFMILGVMASSISGAIRAIESRMDITGAILLAFVNSNAGGTVRDLLLNTTIFWIDNQIYIWLTFAVGSLSFIVIYFNNKIISNHKLHKILIITDAMGLSAFCLAGVEKTLLLSHDMVLAIIMGVWTAIGGGIIADIVANRIPLVFSQELYLTVAFIGAICFLILDIYCGVGSTYAGIIAAFIMIILRLLAVKYKITFPNINR